MVNRCVVTLTSTPERVFKIRPVLESLLAQTRKPDAIILTLPQVFRRTGAPYVVPSWLSDPSDAKYLPGITVYRISRDYGPATKVMGALECERDPETRIIYLDDDAVYHPGMVADMCNRSQTTPGSAIGYSGIGFYASDSTTAQLLPLFVLESVFEQKMIHDCLLRVPALEGHWGVVVKRGFFDLDAFRAILAPDDVAPALYMNDDVSINAHLAQNKIPRLYVCVARDAAVCRRTVVTDQSDYDHLQDALHQQQVPAGSTAVVGGANNYNFSKCLMTHSFEPRYAQFLQALVHDINGSTQVFVHMFQEAMKSATPAAPPPAAAKPYLDLKSLQVYDPGCSKRRVGSKHDGGYVVIDCTTKYDKFLSAGVETNIDFEQAFLQLHPVVECEAFDGTVASFPQTSEQRIHFHKKNIGPGNSDTVTNWHAYLDEYKNVFIKMDIEGSEYEWLNTLTTNHLEHILQLVIEFHSPYKNEQHWKMIDKLNATHYLVHLHGNNYAGIVQFSPNPTQAILPDVFECTFVRKTEFPHPPAYNSMALPVPGLDTPNCPTRQDIQLIGYPYSQPVASPQTVVHTFGDSHAQYGFDNIQGVRHHNIGPKLCYSFGKQGLEVLDLKKFSEVQDGHVVIFAFGEIDCRCHVYKHCDEKTNHAHIIDAIVDSYMTAIDANVRQYASLLPCVLSITPAVHKLEQAETPNYPFLGNDTERKSYVAYFNQALKKQCAQHKYTFIDVHDAYADAEGYLRRELSDGNVHIGNPTYIVAALKQHGILK